MDKVKLPTSKLPIGVNTPVDTGANGLTVDNLKAAMPKRQKHNITQSLVDTLNALVTDDEEREAYRTNLVSYTSVLQDPNVKLENYLHAVRYVSFKLMGYNNQESWIKTFPDKYQRLLDMGKDAVFIRATVSGYAANKIVCTVFEQTMVPTWVVNADLFQKAVNEQATLMTSARSETVRQNAADSLMTHLKQPESTKLQIDVGIKSDDTLKELRDATIALTNAQRAKLEDGTLTAHDVAESDIINGESKRLD